MEWISPEERLPKDKGPYVVSIIKDFGAGKLVFNYVAHYDAQNQDWYKYDPFDPRFKPNEKIGDKILGWIDDVGAYMGRY